LKKLYFERRIGRDLDGIGRNLFVFIFYYFLVGTEKLQKSVRMAIFRPRILPGFPEYAAGLPAT
jgi:hypothetical protein